MVLFPFWGSGAGIEMYTGSDNGPTETYLMPGTSPNHQMTLLPPPQGVNYVSNEVAPELIYDQGLYYPAANYYGYFCAGLEPHGEWDDHHRIFGVDGQEIHYSALETETSPYAYYSHSYGYAQSSYNPYNPCIPGAVAGYDGPIVGLEQYLPNPYNSYIPAIAQTNLDTVPSISVSPLAFDTVSSNSSRQATAGSKFSQSRAYSRIPKSESLQTVSSETSTSVLSNPQMTQGRTFASVQNPSKVPSSSFVPNFGSSVHGWIQNPSKPDKFKSRFQFNGGVKNGNRNVDILGEQNKGPRTNKAKGNSTPAISDAGNAPGSIVISTDQYNQDDFMVDYPSAKFFVIKSYSEDDVHKSIKYNVWSSTPNGNKRLNSAYEDAKMISDVKLGNCPIFLFFSVNASGQFCGVAEMVGPVDCHKDMDFWQQDKWTGSFPVKWHVIKDVPNTSFRHIILENNENKPVTNSRDTQEVTYIPGFKMLKIFKSSPQTTSILDDFMFYEERQKILLEEKSRFTGKIYNTYIPAIVSSNKVSGSLEEKSSAHNTEKDNESGNEKENGLIDTVEVPDDKKATNPNQNGDAGVTNSVIKMNALSIDSNEGSIESDVVSMGSTNNNVKGSGEPESEIATIGSISTESKNNET